MNSRAKSRTKHRNASTIQHHHLLLRMEMRRCPAATDKKEVEALLLRIVKDIHMTPLDKPHMYYVKHPYYNEGLTGIVPIQTSHIAFHFWKNPEPAILKAPNSRCLLEFDLYTCGELSRADIRRVLHHLTGFQPTRADVTVLNRKWSLAIDRHQHWSEEGSETWPAWVERI
jgi:S-adenosylmethionine/arginine decarboxylase-like enzyme